jgi:hypothetical protein
MDLVSTGRHKHSAPIDVGNAADINADLLVTGARGHSADTRIEVGDVPSADWNPGFAIAAPMPCVSSQPLLPRPLV